MERHYVKIFAGIVLIQLLLAGLFPITSDEAYFYTWAVNLDVNYYDHPPMIGWIIFLFSRIGPHIFFFRLFSILTGIIVALLMRWTVTVLFDAREKAELVSLVYLAAPLHLLFIPISTDTPLFLFVFLTGLFFVWGNLRKSDGLILLSGLFLSLAILSKYFAGLLLIALFGTLGIQWRRRSLRYGLLLAIGAAPLGLLHLYWNYQDCWLTVMFNLFNRNKDHSLGLGTFFTFIGFQLYLATPWVIYYLLRNIGNIYRGVRRDTNLFFYLAAIPMVSLAGLSFFDTSLHWTLSFYPFLLLLLVYVDMAGLRKMVRFSLYFSLIHAVVLFVILALPIQTFKFHRYYADIVMGFHGDEISDAIAPYGAEYTFATPGYTTAALMAYHSRRHFVVFNDDDRNGRNDDKVTDFRRLDGKNLLILSTLRVKPKEVLDYDRYFDSFSIDTIEIRGADFTVVFGKGFRYAVYREHYLKKILRDCYDIPGFLPVGDCFFYRRYFPERLTPDPS